MVKLQKKAWCVILSVLLAVGSLLSFPAVFTAAGESTVYFQAPEGWKSAYCYAWKSGGGQGNENGAWPGVGMEKVSGGVYRYTFTDGYSKMVFSDNGDNQTQTSDLDFPGDGMMYVYDTKEWTRYTGEEVAPPPAPSGELIEDPSFENNNGFWTYVTGMEGTTQRSHSGEMSVKSNVRGINGVALFSSKAIPVTPNTEYRLSGYIYRGDGNSWAYLDMNDIGGELQIRAQSYGKWEYVTGLWNSGSRTSVQLRGVVERDYHQTSSSYQGITADNWFDDISFSAVTYPEYSEEPPQIPSGGQSWTLENNDVRMALKESSGRQYITELVNKENGYNWIDGASEVPMLSKVSGENIEWAFSGAQLDRANGTKLTLRFISESPAVRLSSVWEVNAQGPVTHYSELANLTGGQITVDSGEVIAGDALLSIPQDTDVYRFNRSRFNNGLDARFTAGVLKQKLSAGLTLRSPVENSWETNTGILPFQMLQAGGHGLYFGYEWSYGEILARTQKNAGKLRLTASLGEKNETITRENGESFLIPGVFYGAYCGDSDDGSNRMKRWFWDNQMTKTLRENRSEPPIELHIPGYSEAALTGFLDKYDVASWGVGLLKMDYWWTVPTSPGDINSGFDSYLEQQWLPDPGKWPDGMTFGTITKNRYPNMQNSLYMCDTYQGADIGTKEGREKQIAALSKRIGDWKIDYWRSDFDVEAPNTYASHEGLLYILDTLSAEHSNFRYESCSAGGALKDFSTLKRMTFMTMEDSGGALNHRMAFYANSYMINPLQLKFDLGYDWTSPEDASYISQNPREWAYHVLRTAMMGSMMASAVGREMTQVEIEAAKDSFALYNSRQRDILRGGDVYHILPMPDGVNWDGMEFYNKEIEKGSVFLFKNRNNGPSQKTIRLDGLNPSSIYTLTFEDSPALNCVKTGKELMNAGVTVTGMDNPYDTEIIWIEKTGGEEEYTLGDVDNNGKIDLSDVLAVQKYLAKAITLTGTQINAADVTRDGIVAIDDVLRIQMKLAHVIDEF